MVVYIRFLSVEQGEKCVCFSLSNVPYLALL